VPDFYLRLIGACPDVCADIELACESAGEALRIASAVTSPHGHLVGHGDRFLARFEPEWRVDDEEDESDSVAGPGL
jgi:hypothetical protein